METHQNRLDGVEGSLTPAEVVAIWAKELSKFDSLQDYVSWMVEDSSRAPLGRMLRQIKKGIPGVQAAVAMRNLGTCFASDQAELYSCDRLLLGVNEHVWGFLDREEFRLAGLTAGLRGVNERACSLTMMSELWKELAVTPYPLDPDIAAAVLAARRDDVTAIDDLAVEMADHFADQVMHEEGSWVSAYQRLKEPSATSAAAGS